MENKKQKIRPSAVAGFFYPDSISDLKSTITQYLNQAPNKQLGEKPAALIVPHAGYVYSGPIAASAYKNLIPFKEKIKTVILLGPPHRIPVEGVALSNADYFETPLGKIPLNHNIQNELQAFNGFHSFDLAHSEEHSLEVQLPFLQLVLGENFNIVPALIGVGNHKIMAQCFEKYFNLPEILFVISSDLSHYLNYDQASSLDLQTANAICNIDLEKISYDQACGSGAIKIILHLARTANLKPQLLDLRNSGDTSGDKRKVVGYGSFFL